MSLLCLALPLAASPPRWDEPIARVQGQSLCPSPFHLPGPYLGPCLTKEKTRMLPFTARPLSLWAPGAGTQADYFLLCLHIALPSSQLLRASVPVPGHWQHLQWLSLCQIQLWKDLSLAEWSPLWLAWAARKDKHVGGKVGRLASSCELAQALDCCMCRRRAAWAPMSSSGPTFLKPVLKNDTCCNGWGQSLDLRWELGLPISRMSVRVPPVGDVQRAVRTRDSRAKFLSKCLGC